MTLSHLILRFAALAFALFAGSAAAEPQEGRVRLEDGAMLEWVLFDAEAPPALGIALPSYIPWAANAIDGPVRIDLSTNYASFIERWELALYRESDSSRKHPLRVWRGPAAAFDAGVEWDGVVEAGPPLRPGETVVALLRVRDLAGNVDEAKPQTMLLSRYLMPAQERKFNKITRERRASVAAGDPPAIQTIPVEGRLLRATIDGPSGSAPMHVAGLAMDDLGAGRWRLAQIMPAGDFSLKVQTERPILGGTRLVSVGRLMVAVPRGKDRFATVKGTGDIERRKLDLTAEGLTRDGAISGREAARLTLWTPGDASGLYTIAVADPNSPAGLYRDARSRSVVRVRPAPREVPWGAKRDPRKRAGLVKMRAQYPARDAAMLVLPHTDVDTAKFFVSARSESKPPSYLRAGAHYELEPFQGRVFLTDAGRAVIAAYREEAGGAANLDIAYEVRASFAGLNTARPDSSRYVLEDDGASLERLYEASLPVGAVAVQAPPPDQPSWFRRNLGWLMAE